jgi:hypothetical protein
MSDTNSDLPWEARQRNADPQWRSWTADPAKATLALTVTAGYRATWRRKRLEQLFSRAFGP